MPKKKRNKKIITKKKRAKIVNKKSAISSLKAGDEKIEIKKIKKQPTEPNYNERRRLSKKCAR